MNEKPIHPVEQKIFLRFDRVSFSYKASNSRRVKVLDEASFHIHEGEFVSLVGPNGSGKTTVLKLLLGLEIPQSGQIEICGKPVNAMSRKFLGYVPQQPQLDAAFPITVREVVRMGRLTPFIRKYGKEDRAAADEAMETAGISKLAQRSFANLSGGERRRVFTARALASKPRVLMLDEPAANMDKDSEESLYDVLGKLKGSATILIVTHDIDSVSSLNDRVLCMGAPDGKNHGIVQHRIGDETASSVANSIRGKSAVLHDESFPADECYE